MLDPVVVQPAHLVTPSFALFGIPELDMAGHGRNW